MPAKSIRQQRFAAMSSTIKGRKAIKALGRKPMPIKVAKDFRKFPRGFPKGRRGK